MQIAAATPEAVDYVVGAMRERNRIECAALLGPQYEARIIQRYALGDAFMVVDEMPVAIFSVAEPRLNVASVSLFATDAFPKVALRVTHFLARRLFPAIRQRSHRVECYSLGEFEDTRRWLGAFQLRPEAVLRRYGCNGEDFTLFAWTRQPSLMSVECGMS